MGRAPCCDKGSVKKGPWSPEEDRKLREYIHSYGTGGNWIALPSKAGLRRCGKSCRLRWLNYLRPNIKHGGFSDEEDRVICSLFATIGSRWSVIAAQLPGRTDNDIKNYWNTKLKKKLHLLIAAAAGGLPAHTPPPPAVAHPCGFSLEQHHHHATSASSPGLLVSRGSSSLYSVDDGGLYFDLSTNGNDMIGNNSTAVGLESFVFGGLQLQEQDTTQDHLQHHLFPAAAGNGTGHNVMASDGLLLEHNQHRRYYGESSSSSYELEPKPLMVSPRGGRRSSSFFYGDGEEASDGAVQLMERLAW